jgi:DNA-binding NarL/FixJ family response regulator
MRVLIADDSEVFVQRLDRALGEISGVEIVAHARTGAEALEAICKLRPEVVILDIGMPEGSGIEVLESLKRRNVTPVTIVLTNFAFAQYRKRCLQLGASFFFDKSAESAKVSEVLRRLLHGGSEPPADGFNGAGREGPQAA